jgi:hypothetical protein
VDQTLTLSWTRQEADSRRRIYQRALWAVLAFEALIGLYALLAPTSLSTLLGLPAPSPAGWTRLWGALLIFAAALHVPGTLDPVRRRWAGLVGISGRFALALLYAILGGGFWWLAAIEAGLGALLAFLYFALFRAELMSRP